MKSKPKSKTKINKPRLSTVLILVAAILYIALLAAAYSIFMSPARTETGQLNPGETSQSANLNHSLDLRVAAKATYPSDSLEIDHDLGANDGVSEKIISFKVPSDRLTEYGLMTLPASPAPAAGYPTIILCHGYDNPKIYSTSLALLSDMEFYSKHGFAVVKPDYRGQGLSIDQGRANSAYYSMDYNTDVMSLISALKKTKYIDKSNLNLWGYSMGAYIGLRAAVLSPDIKNLILLSGPVDSLSKMYLSYVPPSDTNNLNALKTRNDVFSKYGTPVEAAIFWKYASPINLVSKIKARIQIHVGALDQTVPPEFSADLDATLSQHQIKHDYYVYPDGTHSLAPQRTLIWNRTLQILLAPSQQNTPSA